MPALAEDGEDVGGLAALLPINHRVPVGRIDLPADECQRVGGVRLQRWPDVLGAMVPLEGMTSKREENDTSRDARIILDRSRIRPSRWHMIRGFRKLGTLLDSNGKVSWSDHGRTLNNPNRSP